MVHSDHLLDCYDSLCRQTLVSGKGRKSEPAGFNQLEVPRVPVSNQSAKFSTTWFERATRLGCAGSSRDSWTV